MKTQKEKLKVIIFTAHHKIKGEVHLYENSRLTDILNAETATKDFLPVTDAIVTERHTGAAHQVSFLSINRTLIEMVMEDDESVALARAKELIAKRRYAEALPCAQRAVRAAPENPEGHYTLGFCLAKTGDSREARKAFEKCLSIKPDPHIVHQVEEILKTM